MTDKSDEPHDPTDMDHPDYDSNKDPTSPFYKSNKTEAEQKPEPSTEDTYKVGPGFPPNEHKWKKGCPSPYPKGRPKKVPSMEPEIKKLFEDALNEKIHVTKADKKIILTRLAMGFEQLAIQWAKGGLIQALRDKEVNIVDYKPKGDKQERLISQIDLFMGGSVLLPKDAPWLEGFVAELLSFPGRHDDQVDALAQGLAWQREAWKAPPPRRTFGMGG
jgi:predicted phage terminase large subunit-like protein